MMKSSIPISKIKNAEFYKISYRNILIKKDIGLIQRNVDSLFKTLSGESIDLILRKELKKEHNRERKNTCINCRCQHCAFLQNFYTKKLGEI